MALFVVCDAVLQGGPKRVHACFARHPYRIVVFPAMPIPGGAMVEYKREG